MLDVINRYLHGFAAIPVILACKKNGFFKQLKHHGNMSLEQIIDCTGANSGHLQVALRLLQSLGWLLRDAAGTYMLTEEAESHREIPEDIIELFHLPLARLLESQQGEHCKWIARSCQGWHVSKPLIADFLDGVLVIPVLLAIKQHKEVLANAQKNLFSNLNPPIREALSELFVNKGWAHLEKGELSLTSAGRFMLDRALIMGTAASYAPMLSRMPELLFGSHHAVFQRGGFGGETHVDRTLNVLASGFQHEKYFAEVDEIILVVFNRLPFEEQPKYVADMGCGDGSLLKRIYETIRTQSARGKVLAQYPITMLGADYNQEALAETARTLFDIPHRVFHGDVGDPERMITDLAAHGIHDPETILHVRSFLDHDRSYIPPANLSNMQERTRLAYQGVYADTNGQSIPPAVAVQSLTEHLRRWSSVISKHGLIILEVHCLEPATVHAFLEQSESLHFDACQAFSLQHLVEADVFLMAAAEAGLFAKPGFFYCYPKTFPFSRITLNWFEKRPYTVRHAHPKDLAALVKLEKACWPASLQVSEEVILQRLERFPEGQCVLEMDGLIAGVICSQRISAIHDLETAAFSTISSLHTSDGPVVQLITVNIFPEIQHLGLGDQLLEFMLQYCAVKGGIEQIAGVTRCKNYVRQTNMPMETYIRQRDEQGHCHDPILRFHYSHSAEIKGIVYGYRPEDVDNQGNGVLIEYDIHHRQEVARTTSKSTFPLERDKKTENLNLPGIIEQSIRSVMGGRRLTDYSPKWPLHEMGMDSLDLLELRSLLNRHFDMKLEPGFFFQYGTPQAIARYFQRYTKAEARENHEQQPMPATESLKIEEQEYSNAPLPDDAIAIIGMACRFPNGANSPDAYWSLLRDGIDAISEIPKNRWDNTRYYDPEPEKTGKISTNSGGFLDQVDRFDAAFFRISPKEAAEMDPQQRILLEVSWEALEQAGLSPAALEGSQTAVFTGIFSHDYETLQIKQNTAKDYDSYFGTGNSSSIAAGRLAYFFDFKGSAVSIDTACSSSLVAVHLACQSLRHRECNLALVSGVNLLLSPELSITFSSAGILAPDGRCKTFDASANGYVRSEGCAAIVLKRLPRALADNDNILAVIRGSAINQDGTSNGLTAPNGLAQEAVIRKALSGMPPADISYVEAHGSGTSLGDPVEVKALEAVYGENRTNDNPLFIGSVKTNIGHTEATAGLAGLLKIVLAMQHNYIPPHLHFKSLNPHISLDKIPARITVKGMPWKNQPDKPRLAGLSSFGFSGTNAHLILQEPPRLSRPEQVPERSCHLLTLSARTDDALRELAQAYAAYLNAHPATPLGDLCFTAHTGRTHFDHRLALAAESAAQIREELETFVIGQEESPALMYGKISEYSAPKTAFLFAGQGSQYIGMGQQLYETQPRFRQTIDDCDEILRPCLEKSLLEVLYQTPVTEACFLNETAYTQPALFAIEYALAELWQSWNIKPEAVMGHSVGEYAAACIAGVFSLEDGLKLIAARGHLMQTLCDKGDMLVLSVDESKAAEIIEPFAQDVSIAAVNGPENVVVSGRHEAIEAIALRAKGIKTKRLPVSHAFHSSMMEPMLVEFERAAASVTYAKPSIPLYSNVSGQLATDEIAAPTYWRRHVRQSVRFAASMEALYQQGYEIFVEIGPKPSLSDMGRLCLPDGEGTWLASLRQGQEDWLQLLQSLGKLYVQGVPIEWSGFDKDYPRRRLQLPTYPFQRQRYWLSKENLQKMTSMPLQRQPAMPQNRLKADNETPVLARIMKQQLQAASAAVSQVVSQQLEFLRGSGITVKKSDTLPKAETKEVTRSKDRIQNEKREIEVLTTQSKLTQDTWQLLLVSAQTETELESATQKLIEQLKQYPEQLAEIAHALRNCEAFNHRRMLVCRQSDDAIKALESLEPKRVETMYHEPAARHPVAFMFPGVGDHYVNMARGLYQTEIIFREQVDKCCEILSPYLKEDLREILYPEREKADKTAKPRFDLRKMLDQKQAPADEITRKLNKTIFLQPAVFVIEYALAKLWMSRGIKPHVMIGYSVGEYAAACIAGVISLEEVLLLLIKRARMIQDLPVGSMLAVPFSENDILPKLGEELSIATISTSSQCVVAGPPDAIDNLAKELQEQQVVCRQLQTSHAFHSKMMEPLRKQLIALVSNFALKPPQIPYLSNVTGTWITDAQAADPHYWAQHTCQTVRFADGIGELLQTAGYIFLEAGPGQSLGSFVFQHPAFQSVQDSVMVLPSLRTIYDGQPDAAFLLNSLGKLWLGGATFELNIPSC